MDELFLPDKILVLNPVDLRGPRIHLLLDSGGIVPRANPPRLSLVVGVRKDLDETQLDYAVCNDIKPRALDVEEQQGLLK